jgi:hypothetical protein
MAEHPEVWTDRSPEQRYLFDHPPTFGLANDAERMRQGTPPAARAPRKPKRQRGPMWTFLVLPWSYSDRSAGDVWHRVQCRRGHHQIGGGHSMQLGSTVIFVERRCRWCGAKPS